MSVEPTLETTRFPLTTAPHMTSIVFMPLPFTPTHWRGSTAYSGNLSTPSNDAIAKGVAVIASRAVCNCAESSRRNISGMQEAYDSPKSSEASRRHSAASRTARRLLRRLRSFACLRAAVGNV